MKDFFQKTIKKTKNILSSDKNISSNAIVVYIDILGFSNLLQKESIPNNINSLLKVWNNIKQYYSKRNNVLLNYFSDSLFISYLEVDLLDAENIIGECREDLESIYNFYFENNFFIRGGISYGEIFYNDKLLVGEPVVNAVKYEANLNPGPFIIFPHSEYIKINPNGSLFSSIPAPYELDLKNNQGIMTCYIILPLDKINYINKIKIMIKDYSINGPYQLAKYWQDHLNLINQINTVIQ